MYIGIKSFLIVSPSSIISICKVYLNEYIRKIDNNYYLKREGGRINMFTHRQLTILFYLISNNEGLTSKDLAYSLDVSTKTIQLEIKKINQMIKDEEKIITSTKKGYFIKNISTEARAEVISAIEQNKNKIFGSDRMNKIITLLLFENDYISMEKLAKRFFISKSAINSDLSMLWRLREGTDDAKLEVSLTKGLKIHALESTKRYILSKTLTNDFDLDMLLLSDYGINIEEVKNKLMYILEEAFIEYNYIVSGESLEIFKNYLLISIIRNKCGFKIEEKHSQVKMLPIMQYIIEKIQDELEFIFDVSELAYNQKKLNELNVLYDKQINTDNKQINNDDMNYKVNVFMEKIKEDLDIDFQCSEEFRDMFLLHMEKLLLRIEDNHNNTNFHKREINSEYPMSAHIISEYLLPIFNLKIAESEIAYLVLYIASEIENKKNPLRVLVISNFNASILYNLKTKIESNFANLSRNIDIIPLYLFNAKKHYLNERYDVVITTENEVLLLNSQAILIKSIISDKDITTIRNQVNKISLELEKERFKSMYTKLIDKESIIIVKQTISTIEEVFTLLHLKYEKNNYDIVLNSNATFFPRFMNGEKESYIKVCILKQSIKYKSKDINLVVVSGYNIQDKNIKEFYSMIKYIISPHQVENIIKTKTF